MHGRDIEIGVIALEIAHGEVGEALGDAVHVKRSHVWLERIFPRQGAVCCNNVSRHVHSQNLCGVCLQFSAIIMSFPKSSGAMSDTTLAVMTSFLTPAATAASSMRVVPVTAVYKMYLINQLAGNEVLLLRTSRTTSGLPLLGSGEAT